MPCLVVAVLLSVFTLFGARAAQLTELETRWLQAGAPVIAYAREQRLPLDVVVEPQARPGDAPLAMGFLKSRCKLVLALRGNPAGEDTLARIEPALLQPVLEAMFAHELGHCWRYVHGAWHTLPAGFVDASDDTRLDQDLAPFEARAPLDPPFGALVGRLRGLRALLLASPFEALVWAIVGQQINIAFAYRLKRALIERFGGRLEHDGRVYCLFPDPERLAALEPDALRPLQFSGQKARYIVDLARQVAALPRGTTLARTVDDDGDACGDIVTLTSLHGLDQNGQPHDWTTVATYLATFKTSAFAAGWEVWLCDRWTPVPAVSARTSPGKNQR